MARNRGNCPSPAPATQCLAVRWTPASQTIGRRFESVVEFSRIGRGIAADRRLSGNVVALSGAPQMRSPGRRTPRRRPRPRPAPRNEACAIRGVGNRCVRQDCRHDHEGDAHPGRARARNGRHDAGTRQDGDTQRNGATADAFRQPRRRRPPGPSQVPGTTRARWDRPASHGCA